MNAKYVVIRYNLTGETIYVFPEHVTHRIFAQYNAGMGDKIVSAGFVAMENDGLLMCYGESESIGIKSRPEEDSVLANTMFGRV